MHIMVPKSSLASDWILLLEN